MKIEEFIVRAGAASSKSEARRFINQGSIKINGDKISPDIKRIYIKY